MQPSVCDPACDRPAAEPERQQSATGDDAVLARRELCDRSLVRAGC